MFVVQQKEEDWTNLKSMAKSTANQKEHKSLKVKSKQKNTFGYIFSGLLSQK